MFILFHSQENKYMQFMKIANNKEWNKKDFWFTQKVNLIRALVSYAV